MLPLSQILADLRKLGEPSRDAGGFYLDEGDAHIALKLIRQINPNASDWRTVYVSIGLTIVGLGPPASDGGRYLSIFQSGTIHPLWRNFKGKPQYIPQYFAKLDGTVNITHPRYK